VWDPQNFANAANKTRLPTRVGLKTASTCFSVAAPNLGRFCQTFPLEGWSFPNFQHRFQLTTWDHILFDIALGSVSAEFWKNECDSMSNTYNYNVNFFVSTKLNSTSSQIKHYQFLVGKSDRKQYREQGFKKPNKGTLSFEDVSAQTLATSPLREIPQTAVIVRESLPKMPERFRNYRNIHGQRCICWISPQMKSCIQKMGTQSRGVRVVGQFGIDVPPSFSPATAVSSLCHGFSCLSFDEAFRWFDEADVLHDSMSLEKLWICMLELKLMSC